VAAVAAVVVEGRASIRSAAAAAFDSPGEAEGQTELQGIGVEGSTGTRCWHWGKTPRLEEDVLEHSTAVEMVAGGKIAREVVREGALEGGEVAAVEVVVVVVAVAVVDVVVADAVVAAIYTARASDHTAQNSHTKDLVLVLRCSVAEAGQEGDNTQDSRTSS